jgi:hypothetical protein
VMVVQARTVTTGWDMTSRTNMAVSFQMEFPSSRLR